MGELPNKNADLTIVQSGEPDRINVASAFGPHDFQTVPHRFGSRAEFLARGRITYLRDDSNGAQHTISASRQTWLLQSSSSPAFRRRSAVEEASERRVEMKTQALELWPGGHGLSGDPGERSIVALLSLRRPLAKMRAAREADAFNRQAGRSTTAIGICRAIPRQFCQRSKLARLSAPINQTKRTPRCRRAKKLNVIAVYLAPSSASNAVTCIRGWVARRRHAAMRSAKGGSPPFALSGLPGVTTHHTASKRSRFIAVVATSRCPAWGGLNVPPITPTRMPGSTSGVATRMAPNVCDVERCGIRLGRATLRASVIVPRVRSSVLAF